MSKKKFIGKVVSDKTLKTAIVQVSIPKRHRIYGKKVRNSKRFMAHNEIGAKVGDSVTIEESRPLSRNKRWIILKKN